MDLWVLSVCRSQAAFIQACKCRAKSGAPGHHLCKFLLNSLEILAALSHGKECSWHKEWWLEAIKQQGNIF